jgi:hypothetical protein
MTREIYLLERVLQLGAEIRGDFTWQGLVDDLEPVGFMLNVTYFSGLIPHM